MDTFCITGGTRLSGELRIKGSKNAALPLMAASLLTDRPLQLADVPDLSDIRNMLRLLEELGVECEFAPANDPGSPGGSLLMRSSDESVVHARYDIVRTMRASICVLGPMLARRGTARVSMPGGCAIGDRPVDLHLHGLRALGARIELEQGDIIAAVPPGGRLKGARVFMGGPFGSTVLGTANVLSAACLADGETVIEAAACEPEIVDLSRLLVSMGARIRGAGSPRITVEGVRSLGGAEHRVIPDRIEAGTYMAASAITKGDVTLHNCPLDALMAATNLLARVGVRIDEDRSVIDPMRATCRITAPGPLRPVELTTQPHPGFPTDLQAQFLALLSLADGNSVITEKIYPQRFLHVAELQRMGASVIRQGSTCVVAGVPELHGAPVMASDLRASASLVLAGLAAKGQTTINRVYHLDRGYETMEQRLASLGAQIRRVAAAESVGAA